MDSIFVGTFMAIAKNILSFGNKLFFRDIKNSIMYIYRIGKHIYGKMEYLYDNRAHATMPRGPKKPYSLTMSCMCKVV